MAKKYDNKEKFLIIEMNTNEAFSLGFGFADKELICDQCNELITDKCYYIAALNMAYCEECLKDFIENQIRYFEDIKYEVEHYNKIADKLGLKLTTINYEKENFDNE